MLKMEAIVGKILTKDKYVLIELRKTRNVMPWSGGNGGQCCVDTSDDQSPPGPQED